MNWKLVKRDLVSILLVLATLLALTWYYGVYQPSRAKAQQEQSKEWQRDQVKAALEQYEKSLRENGR